jgi:predicted RecB family endonuclease
MVELIAKFSTEMEDYDDIVAEIDYLPDSDSFRISISEKFGGIDIDILFDAKALFNALLDAIRRRMSDEDVHY